jgi:hypothetical protein
MLRLRCAHAPALPCFNPQRVAEQIRLNLTPAKAEHVAPRIEAAKCKGIHGVRPEIMLGRFWLRTQLSHHRWGIALLFFKNFNIVEI